MAADRVLCSKPCALQNPQDKSYTDGTLYVYQTLARFVSKGGAAQHRVEFPIDDIKGQKRSKTNPMIMLETHSQVRPVLKFMSMDDREEVSASILQATAAAQQAAAQPSGSSAAPAGTAPSAAAAAADNQSATQLGQRLTSEQRQAILIENRTLAGQYKTLVVDGQALTDDEFWNSPAVHKVAGLAGMPVSSTRANKRGLANRLVDLARQRKTTAGGDDLWRLDMTEDDEQQLFAEKPALKQLYDAKVGTFMTREVFWEAYFRYYMDKHKKREGRMKQYKQLQHDLMANSAAAVAAMTGEEHKADAAMIPDLNRVLDDSSTLDDDTRKALKRRLNPAVDLAAAAEDRMTADGYGLAHNPVRSEVEQVQGYSAFSQYLAQDYNIHAAAVIGQGPAASAAPSSSRPASAAAGSAGQPGTQASNEMTGEQLQQYKKQAGSGLDDLQAPIQQQFEVLHVTNPRLYFSKIQQQPQQQGQGQVPTVKQELGAQQMQPQDVVQVLRSIDPNALTDRPMQDEAARKVLLELCGGDVADAARRGGPDSLPLEQRDFMQRQSMVVDELLRHFWALLPVNTTEKEEKVKRIKKSLDDTHKLLSRVSDECVAAHKAALTRLMRPLWDQVDVVNTAYTNIMRALQRQQRAKQQPQK